MTNPSTFRGTRTLDDTLGSGFHQVYNVTGTVGAVDPNYRSGLLSGWDTSINLERSDLTRRPGSLWFEASRPGTGRGARQRSGSFASDHIRRNAPGQRLATLLH